MAEVAAIVILVALLALVIRPPRPWPELAWGAPAAALVVLTGLESPGEAWDAVHALAADARVPRRDPGRR